MKGTSQKDLSSGKPQLLRVWVKMKHQGTVNLRGFHFVYLFLTHRQLVVWIAGDLKPWLWV